MFVPSESIFAEIHENFEAIVHKAHRARIVIVSPSLLMLSIQVIQAILKDARMREQAHLIQGEVVRLMEDVARLDERVRKLQTHFGQAAKDIDDILVSAIEGHQARPEDRGAGVRRTTRGERRRDFACCRRQGRSRAARCRFEDRTAPAEGGRGATTEARHIGRGYCSSTIVVPSNSGSQCSAERCQICRSGDKFLALPRRADPDGVDLRPVADRRGVEMRAALAAKALGALGAARCRS